MEARTIKINSNIRLIIAHIFMPLFVGGIIYVLFRSKDLRLFNWFSIIKLDSFINITRIYLYGFKCYLPNWVLYSLPDGLWVYSFTSALLILWNGKLTLWLILPIVTGVFVEIAQEFKIFPGTFDIIDLTFTGVALLLSFIFINSKSKQNEETVS